ncbi:MAG: asparagine synthase (glutamine-hydrolyzing) [Deltaproteobacteria bacterium]|nr:asparagine synthase (glutamine-hydrolyzing) [Deltaproteobacteria bacterium]
MCGIFLHLTTTPDPEVLHKTYRNLSANLSHRGPDAMGVSAIPANPHRPLNPVIKEKNGANLSLFCPLDDSYFKNCMGFMGQHRLSIIDPDPRAGQPMTDASSMVAVVFNGEIYNYIKLKAQLQKQGHCFTTTSDTEVLLHAYLEWGDTCFNRFNGDFAIIIYDHRTRQLIGARDRFGIKPLFYYCGNNTITLASELKGFINLPGFVPQLNTQTAYHYLVANFPNQTTLQNTFLKNIHPVPGAHVFKISASTHAITFSRYWDLDNTPPSHNSTDQRSIVEGFESLFNDAVKIRLRSDVPRGLMLSGGIDSPSIASCAVKTAQDIPSFSCVFKGFIEDESVLIDEIAEHLGLINIKHEQGFSDFFMELRDLVWLQDEPFTTLNVYSQYKLLKIARTHGVKVILDGTGADEFLAGYTDYRIPAALDTHDTSFLSGEEKILIDHITSLSKNEFYKWCEAHQKDERSVPYINKDWKQKNVVPLTDIERPLDPLYIGLHQGSYLKHALKHSLQQSWMNKSVAWDNRYLDRNGMSLGIEGRVPFQDHRLVAYAFGLPVALLHHKGLSKVILRETLNNSLPDHITSNPCKKGFTFPFVSLIAKDNHYHNFFMSLAKNLNPLMTELVEPQKVIAELDRMKNQISSQYNLWRVFNLSLWCDLFL